MCFMLSTLLVSGVCLQFWNLWTVGAVLCLSIGTCCGLLGLTDDLAKNFKRSNTGISGYVRLLIELSLGFLLGFSLLLVSPESNAMLILPKEIWAGTFAWSCVFLPPIMYLTASSFYVAASCNAVNLHDGMDGLAAGTSTQIFACLCLLFFWTGGYALACVSAVAAGAMLAFLCFNRYTDRLFMGDVGSLFV